MGHHHTQFSFSKDHAQFRLNHGGSLRNHRRGRKFRPLSTKHPLHLVFKADKKNLRRGLRSRLGFYLCNHIIKAFAKRFFVKVEQLAICGDHIHLIVRFSRRSLGQHFLRVVAGQIAQQFEKNKMTVTDTQSLWKHRPFSRIVLGSRAYRIVQNYVQLNEKEARGEIRYNKKRLRGLSTAEWGILWS